MLLGGPAVVVRGEQIGPAPPTWPSAIEMGQAYMPREQMYLPGRFWNKRIPDGATVHANSATWVSSLCDQLDVDPTTGNPVPDAWPGRAQVDGAIPCYVVPEGYPETPVSLWNPAGAVGGYNLDYWIKQGVPLPEGWIAGASADHYMNVVQPSTHRMWEFFQLDRDSAGNVKTSWGGYSHDYRTFFGSGVSGEFIDGHPSTFDDWFPSAASISLLGGILQREEVEAGVCNHPLQMSVASAGNPWIWPARRGDGWYGVGYPPEGALFRFPVDVDVDWVWSRFRTGHEIAAADLAKAKSFVYLVTETVRDFGMYIVDQTTGGYPTLGGCALQLRDYRQASGYQHSWPEWFGTAWYPNVNLSSYMYAWPWHQAQVLDPIA